MNLILCFFFLSSLAPKRCGTAAAAAVGEQHDDVPSFIQKFNDDDQAYALQSSSNQEINALITNLSNNTKPVSEMTINERVQLSELLYDHYKTAFSLIHHFPVPIDNVPKIKTSLQVLIDTEESTDKNLRDVTRMLRSIASVMEGGGNEHHNDSEHTTNQGFQELNSEDKDSSWHGNSSRHHRRTTEKSRLHTHRYKNMRLDNHHERILKLQEAVEKGDFRYVHSHMYGDNHRGGASSWSHSGGTREGRRLAREARRLSSKADKCKVLADCARRMSDYDLFVYVFSDDIDHATGDIDSNVKKVFGENISEMKTEISTLTTHILAGDPGFDNHCNDLLKMFHRTVEVDKIPQWEGATISQVCLAEGTTVYVDLGAAAKTALPAASRNFCQSNWHGIRYGDGREGSDDDSNVEKHGVVCCADKKIGHEWEKKSGCSVWAATSIDGMCFKGFKEKTWDEADAICKGVGARLCSAIEIESKCATGMSDKTCDMDDTKVWTETCTDMLFVKRYASHWTACGEKGDCYNKHGNGNDNEKLEGDDWVKRAVRCCSDEDLDYWVKSCDDGRDVWTNTQLEGNNDDACKITYWWEAEKRCTEWQEGSRLCTLDELKDGCAQKKDCGYDDRMVWSKTPSFPDGVEKLSSSISHETKLAFENDIVPGFVKEVLICARDLFYTEDRENDSKYSGEKFVFGYYGRDPGADLNKYRIPKGLSTDDSSMRTEHGQIKNNDNPPFTFVTVQHLIDDFHVCREEAQEILIKTANDKYGSDKYTATHTEIISYLEAGIDAYEEKIKDTCITNFFSEITLGLKLVFGDKPSPGFICGVKEVIKKGNATMPGSCCLDAPFNLNDQDWGYSYDCKLTCKNPGSYFAGMSEEACSAQGGTWCPNKNDCLKLKECVGKKKREAKNKNPSFEDYLNRSPEIKDPNDAEQCGKARQYFGHDENFVNDEQVCEDIQQLSFSKDFEFLNEFFGQGSEGGISTTGDKDIENPEVPALVLTEVNREITRSKKVQNGPAWSKANFSLGVTLSAITGLLQIVIEVKCNCEKNCQECVPLNAAKGMFYASLKPIEFCIGKVLEISEFTMGQLAEQNNIQPMQVWENSQAVYGNMDETGNWLQARFEDLGKYFEDEFDLQTEKLKQVQTVVERRDLSVNQSISGFSSMDEERESCHDLKMDIVIGNLSPRTIVCHLKCGNSAINPHVLEVRAVNAKRNEVVVEHKSFELEKGLIILEIPDYIEANIFIIGGRLQNFYSDDDLVVEESISFPVKNMFSLSSYIHEKWFV